MTSSNASKQSGPVSLFVSLFISIGTILLIISLCIPSAQAVPEIDVDLPYTADAEFPINVTVNVVSELNISHVNIYYENPSNGNYYNYPMNLTAGNLTNGTWYFSIPPQNYKGTLDVWIDARDISGVSDRYPSTGSFDIELEGPEPAKPFPWNIVIIVAFLAVTLIATELIFKPGFYRPTGRQRAQALEEEDRIRELEEKDN